MNTVRVYAAKDETVAIRCPECDRESLVHTAKISKYELKVRCTCKKIFLLQLELRKKRRRSVSIDGFFQKLEQTDELEERPKDSLRVSIKFRCKIKNISQEGIGVLTERKHELQTGDVLLVSFTIGETKAWPLEKTVVVRHIDDNYLGCEFTEDHKNDKQIGFFTLA